MLGSSVSIQPSIPGRVYFEGDAVCGNVVLALRGAGCHVRSLRVALGCTEKVDLRPHGGQQEFEHYRDTHTLTQEERVCAGDHDYSYAMEVPRSHQKYPPSLEVEGTGNGGIWWWVQAWAELEATDGKTKTVEDMAMICVFPAPSFEETVALGKSLSIGLAKEGIKCLVSMPALIPQAPEIFGAKVVVELDEPAHVRSVHIFLESCIVMWLGAESKVFSRNWSIDAAPVDATTSKVELDGSVRRWQVDGPLPARFSSAGLHLRYSLWIAVDLADSEAAEFTMLETLLASPGGQHQRILAEPPAYTPHNA